MKKAIAGIALTVVSFAGINAHAAETTASATATVITPISISKTADLRFGKFAAGPGGTVKIATAGTRTATGVVLSTVTPGGAAGFTVTGDVNATYAITLPANGVITISDGGLNSMAVDAFESDPASSGTIGGSGTQAVAVGATLTVGNAQAVGTYSGTFPVTVEYN